MYYLPTSVILIVISVCIFIYTFKNRNEKKEKNNFINEVITGCLLFIGGFLFPFMYNTQSDLSQDTLDILWIFTFVTISLVVIGIGLIFLNNAIKCKKDTSLKVERNYEMFCKNFLDNWKYDLKKDVSRKLAHLIPAFLVFVIWIIGTILDNLGILAQYGLDNYSFSMWFFITSGLSLIIFFVIGDLVRLNFFYFMPKTAINWYAKSLKDDELYTFVSSSLLVLAFIPFIFAPFPIFVMVILISTVADSSASLVGKKYGKHKFRKESKKTIEGYIAGAGTTFLLVIIISGLYYHLLAVEIIVIMMMAIVATFLFFLVDAVLSENITDNLLNPIFTGFGIWVVFIFM